MERDRRKRPPPRPFRASLKVPLRCCCFTNITGLIFAAPTGSSQQTSGRALRESCTRPPTRTTGQLRRGRRSIFNRGRHHGGKMSGFEDALALLQVRCLPVMARWSPENRTRRGI